MVAICLFGVPPGLSAPWCARGTLTGEVTYLRDGDTIKVGGLPIRLQGLAPPERDEAVGAEASSAMLDLVLGEQGRCLLDGERTHDRCVATCYLKDTEIAELMVRQGLGRDCPRFSGGRYWTA